MPKGEADPGTDTVMMQEDCTPDGDAVVLRPGIKPGSKRRKAGEERLVLGVGRAGKRPDLVGRVELAEPRRCRVGDALRQSGHGHPLIEPDDGLHRLRQSRHAQA